MLQLQFSTTLDFFIRTQGSFLLKI